MSVSARQRALATVRLRVVVSAAALALSACGGAVPLMHGAHPTPPGQVRVGAGVSASVTVKEASEFLLGEADDLDTEALRQAASPRSLAPWIAGRIGFASDYDAGLIYTGRVIRLDGRRSFRLGDGGLALSLGLGASGVLPKRQDDLGLRAGGFGADVPILIGYRSAGGSFGVWFGLRGGIETLSGRRERVGEAGLSELDPIPSDELSAWHAHGGALLGLRLGMGRVDASLELGASMHVARGTLGAVELELQRFALSPATAIVARFD